MKKIPLIHAFAIFLVWLCITFFNTIFFKDGNVSLEEIIGKGLNFQIITAALILLAYVFFNKIYRTAGINKATHSKNWILIYPIIIISICLGFCIYKGIFHSPSILIWVIINTFFVGISEELMFRGILLGSLIPKFSFWKSVLIMSLLFGLVHILNGYTTGDFAHAYQQAFFATFSGLLFVAIRVKKQSIIPSIIVHWIWDMTVFFIVKSVSKDIDSISMAPIDEQIITISLLASPLVFGITGIIQLNTRYISTEQIIY